MPSNINAEDFGRVVEVEYDYSYKANDGRTVAIKQGQKYVLIKKSNEDWWQVIDKSQKKPLYVPAAYVKESSQKQFLLDHPFFKKAHKVLLAESKATDSYEQPQENSSDKVVLRVKTADGNGMGSASKWSDLRASTASLDKFIENENPYDVVPYSVDEDQTSEFSTTHEPVPTQRSPASPLSSTLVHPPARWSKETNQYNEAVLVDNFTGEVWIQLVDPTSNSYYYFNEKSKETVWDLPFLEENTEAIEDVYAHVDETVDDRIHVDETVYENTVRRCPDDNELDRLSARDSQMSVTVLKSRSLPKERRQAPPIPPNAKNKPKNSPHTQENFERMMTSRSIGMFDSPSASQRSKPDHSEMVVVMKGKLNCAKVAEAGKKVKKSWLQLWTKGNPMGKPDSSCELRGSEAQWTKDKSSKKNVLEVSTVTGYSFLLQHDDTDIICDWYKFIDAAIKSANELEPLDRNYLTRKTSRDSSGDDSMDDNHVDVKDKKKKDKDKGRKDKKGKPPSRHGSDARQTDKVRSKLKKFIGRRPTMESLQEKGIIKGLNVDGIYRVSGNLSHVQKLRYQIDRELPVKLDTREWEDIHVITGALKLFLRELPEPVIPFKFFDKYIATCKILDRNSRREETKRLIHAMPKPNKDTLQFLMRHFCKVVEHSDSNRMQVQNIAIVFGPTLLLKPPDADHHDGGGMMAVYMMYQNQIIDYMLTEARSLF